MPKTKVYPVESKLRHDGESYDKGDDVELTEEQARPLLSLGAISKPSDGKVVLKAPEASVKPEGDDLTLAIMNAIDELDREQDFTQAGSPRVKSVEVLLGYDVSAEDVDVAWAKYPGGNE